MWNKLFLLFALFIFGSFSIYIHNKGYFQLAHFMKKWKKFMILFDRVGSLSHYLANMVVNYLYCNVFYALCSMHCVLFIVFQALYYIHYLLCIVYNAMNSMYIILCIVFWSIYSMHFIICHVFFAFYYMYCIICIIFTLLYALNGSRTHI